MLMTDRKDKKRRRRRSGLVDVFNGLLTLLVLGLLIAGGLFFYGVSQFYATGPVEEEATFLVERGSSLGLVASRLESQGLISNRLIFQSGGLAMRKQSALKPGEFRIPAGASMADILALFTEGKAVEYFITVPEGATSWQVAQRLNDPTQNLTGDPVAVPPEGSILPGRYDYFPRDDRQAVLDEMQAKMRDALDKL